MIRLRPETIHGPMTQPVQSPLRLRPELTELDHVVGYIETFADQHGLNSGDTYALTLAAEELFANTVNHSKPPATLVEFSLAYSGDTAIATYADDAQPYDPTQQAAPDTSLPAEMRPIGGLGVHFIRKTMEVFQYARQDGRNIVTFTRRLKR